MDLANQHPAFVAAVAAILAAFGGAWVAMGRVRAEIKSLVVEVVEPMLERAVVAHDGDEDAHQAAGAKVRKERQEMFNDLRDRMEEQHEKVIVGLTKLEANQAIIASTLNTVALDLKKLKSEHDRIVTNEVLRKQRYGDMNGLDFTNVRHEDRPKRVDDPEGEDHRNERGK